MGENRIINTGGGNYIERIEGDYIQGNNHAARQKKAQSSAQQQSSSTRATEAIEVFFSYSHADEKLRDELAKHLSNLQKQNIISAWYDRDISAGNEWAGEIDAHLDSAKIILLLISADFLASDYCFDIELARAMERHEAGEAVVIPVILRPVDWEGSPFSKLQALPKNAKPITRWEDRDEAFLDVVKGIGQAVEGLKGNP